MRIRQKANVVILEDKDGKNKLLALDDAASEVILDGFQEHSSGRAAIAAAGVFNIPFGSVGTARGLFLRASHDFSLVLNGGPALDVKRGVTGSGGSAFAASASVLLEAALSTVQVTAVADLGLIYAIWGDPLQ